VIPGWMHGFRGSRPKRCVAWRAGAALGGAARVAAARVRAAQFPPPQSADHPEAARTRCAAQPRVEAPALGPASTVPPGYQLHDYLMSTGFAARALGRRQGRGAVGRGEAGRVVSYSRCGQANGGASVVAVPGGRGRCRRPRAERAPPHAGSRKATSWWGHNAGTGGSWSDGARACRAAFRLRKRRERRLSVGWLAAARGGAGARV
jgi:hypothetical protein